MKVENTKQWCADKQGCVVSDAGMICQLEVLEMIELHLTQARIASTIGPQSGKHGQKKMWFLRGEMDRIGTIARAAIAEAEKGSDT